MRSPRASSYKMSKQCRWLRVTVNAKMFGQRPILGGSYNLLGCESASGYKIMALEQNHESPWVTLLNQNTKDFQSAFAGVRHGHITMDCLPSRNDTDLKHMSSLHALPMEEMNVRPFLSVHGLGVVTLKQSRLQLKKSDSVDSVKLLARLC